ncbi:putative DNA-binding domain-containing protein, partial [Mycobacterium tuberculosis]|nr:putative DNA-binding domain-containing protein [Mycobacterium tuberculosis]
MPPEIQAAIAAALVAPDRPVPAGLEGRDGRPAGRRFAVYRNNVVVSLIDALAARFPVVAMLVGDAFFRA